LKSLVLSFWVAFGASAALAFPILQALIGLKSRQVVSQYVPEHSQKQGTPTMGGLIVVFGALFGLVAVACSAGLPAVWPNLAQPFPGGSTAWPIDSKILFLWPYLVLLVGYAAIGFLDDFVVPRVLSGKRGLGWKQKLGLEILIAALAMAYYPGATISACVVRVFVILFFSNAYNFLDGMDGLAGGVGIFLLIGLAMLDRGQTMVTYCALVLIGGIVPFLALNAPPAKVFMGDVGSLPIGAWIGVMVLQLAASATANPISLVLISLVLVVELVPVPLQIASVKLRKKRLFMMTPIHHGFEKKGIAETRVVWGFILCQLMFSAASVSVQWYLVDGR
jgi:phospho-N-acetylmuramoyl-pentapeptide-transferase